MIPAAIPAATGASISSFLPRSGSKPNFDHMQHKRHHVVVTSVSDNVQ